MPRPLPTIAEAFPERVAWFSSSSPLQAHEVTTTGGEEVVLTCQQCGADRPMQARNAAKTALTANCLKCSMTDWPRPKRLAPLSKTHPKLAKLFSPNSPVKAKDVTAISKEVATFVCSSCGDEHSGRVRTVLARKDPSVCPKCRSPYPSGQEAQRVKEGRPSVADLYPHLVPLLSSENPFTAQEMASYSNTRVLVDCPDCGATRRVRLRSASAPTWTGRCSTCSALQRTEAKGPVAVTHPAVAARFSPASVLRPEDVTAQSSKRATFICLKCENDFESKIANQTRPAASGHCFDCARSGARLESRD